MTLSKILVVLATIAVALAQHNHHASSYASVNSYNTHVSHEYKPHSEPEYQPGVAATASIPYHHSHHATAPADHHAASIAIKAAPVSLKSIHHEEHSYHYPKFQFKYSVEDKKTDDIKSPEESRYGDVVKGSYTLLQPDGRTRTVHYTADKRSGFQASVEYSSHANHPEV